MSSQLMVTLWWLGFFAAVGLCLGSFLNVVIHRLPRDQSLRDPLWSACPFCRRRIRWYDNIPIISLILLRGRCRDCRAPIPTRYLVVEVSMALVVLMLLDAFFIGQVRAGLSTSRFGLTDHLCYDWPILVAHIILFACLLSMSGIDLEHYWVDVRFTSLVVIAGLVLHTLWTPRHSETWTRPYDTTAVMSLFAMAGLGIVWIALRFRSQPSPENDDEFHQPAAQDEPPAAAIGPAPNHDSEPATAPDVLPEPAPALEPTEPAEDRESLGRHPPDRPSNLWDRLSNLWDRPFKLWDRPSSRSKAASPERPIRIVEWMAGLILVALFVSLLAVEGTGATDGKGVWPGFAFRAALPLVFFFLVISRESSVARESDQEVIEAIDEERHGARRMVLGEFALLLPAVALAAVGFWIMRGDTPISAGMAKALHTSTRIWELPMLRTWAPLYGLATAASGYVIAGALGWGVRIVFTLLFGKEAFGLGDIHLMAAGGCVAGWPVAVLGFFVACGLALLGWLISLPFKRTRALPLGPWLALSFLTVVLFYETLVNCTLIARTVDTFNLLFLRNSQIVNLGRLP